MTKIIKIALVALIPALLLVGCGGPSTTEVANKIVAKMTDKENSQVVSNGDNSALLEAIGGRPCKVKIRDVRVSISNVALKGEMGGQKEYNMDGVISCAVTTIHTSVVAMRVTDKEEEVSVKDAPFTVSVLVDASGKIDRVSTPMKPRKD